MVGEALFRKAIINIQPQDDKELFMKKLGNDVKVIIIAAELIMYGDVNLRLEEDQNGINAYWFAMADGGYVVDEREKAYPGKDFSELCAQIQKTRMPRNPDDNSSVEWTVQFGNSENELIYETEFSNWGYRPLEIIIEKIESYLGDAAPVQWLKNMLGM